MKSKLIRSAYAALAVTAAALAGCNREGDHSQGKNPSHEHHPQAEIAPSSTLKISVTTDGDLVPGKQAQVILTVTDTGGKPLSISDFEIAHTRAIHLLIIDETLTDYHHEHPVPTPVPGQYSFTFTPQKSGSYRIWVDVVPKATGGQQYAIADVGTASGATPDKSIEPISSQTIDGLEYELTFDASPLKLGEAASGSVKITKSDGSSFDQLEPIMGAFAHIVAFYPDRATLAHVHPMGAEPTADSDRGLGALKFHLMPKKAGLIRLFVQIQIGGRQKFIPFLVSVS
jgi:hypothetical protein